MVDKISYIERFKEIYLRREGVEIDDADALEHFESLVVLVGAITSHVGPKEVILQEV